MKVLRCSSFNQVLKYYQTNLRQKAWKYSSNTVDHFYLSLIASYELNWKRSHPLFYKISKETQWFCWFWIFTLSYVCLRYFSDWKVFISSLDKISQLHLSGVARLFLFVAQISKKKNRAGTAKKSNFLYNFCPNVCQSKIFPQNLFIKLGSAYISQHRGYKNHLGVTVWPSLPCIIYFSKNGNCNLWNYASIKTRQNVLTNW